MKGGTLARVWWGGKAWGKLCKLPRASYSGGMANSSEADSEELRRFVDKARERSTNYRETAERTRREAAALAIAGKKKPPSEGSRRRLRLGWNQ